MKDKIPLDNVNPNVNMQDMLRLIVYCKSVSGGCSIEEFLESLSPKQAQKTPHQAIKIAEKRKNDFFQRKK